MPARITLAVLSVHSAVVELAERVAASSDDIELVRSATSWDDLIEGGLPAAIVLVDIELDDALPLIRQVRGLGARVVAVTSDARARDVVPAMAAGADAALHRSELARRFVTQVRLTANRAGLIESA